MNLTNTQKKQLLGALTLAHAQVKKDCFTSLAMTDHFARSMSSTVTRISASDNN